MLRNTMVSMVLALALGVGGAACKKDGPLTEEQVKKMSDEELAESAVKMAESLAAAVAANKGNCDKMGPAVTQVIKDYAPLQARSKEFDKDPAKKKWFDEKYSKRAMEPMQTALPALMECKDNASVQKAFESLG